MQWSSDRNAGFSRANPQQLYLPVVIGSEYHYESLNVEAQQDNPRSLLWWMKRLIALRKRSAALSRGSIEFLYPENRRVLVFLRQHEDERILVVVNLSRSVQYAELDLSAYRGLVPTELFGGTVFPPIGELPYFLTLGPHSFYWFRLEPQTVELEPGSSRRIPSIEVAGAWHHVVAKRHRPALEDALPGFLREARWFGGKARRIKSAQIVESIPVGADDAHVAGLVAIVDVEYAEGDPETYVLPLACASVERSRDLLESYGRSVVARVQTAEGERVLHEALGDPELPAALLDAIRRRRRIAGDAGYRLEAYPTKAFRRVAGTIADLPDPRPLQAEQSNSSVAFGDRLVLKLFRRLDLGINPELEIGRFLTDRAGFAHVPPVAGAIELHGRGTSARTLGVLHGFVPNEGDAWSYTQDRVRGYLEGALARTAGRTPVDVPAPSLFEVVEAGPPELAVETMAPYLEAARLLGRRTGELHLALASDGEDPAFVPEKVNPFSQRALYQSLRGTANATFQLLRSRPGLEGAEVVLGGQSRILERFRSVMAVKILGARTRVHGDLHLGQVLYTGRDFVIIDLEGEPARPIGERRIKRLPLVDVAGMIRSFHYAAHSAARAGDLVEPEQAAAVEPWVRLWRVSASAAYLREYLDVVEGAPFAGDAREEARALLPAFLLEKALYEVAYEANHRPEWLPIAVAGFDELLEGDP
jgi:maltose alpha-D-glucosyltransferase/alpha-amylase